VCRVQTRVGATVYLLFGDVPESADSLYPIAEPERRRLQLPRGLRHQLSSSAQTVRSWVESHSRHGCQCASILGSCSVCRQRPCDGLIPSSRSPTTLYRTKKVEKQPRPKRGL
jgi:hypothetical protein